MKWTFLLILGTVLSQTEVNLDHQSVVDITRGSSTTLVMTANLTTGCRWSVAQSPDEITIEEMPYRAPKTQFMGASGQQVWEITTTESTRDGDQYLLGLAETCVWSAETMTEKEILLRVDSDLF